MCMKRYFRPRGFSIAGASAPVAPPHGGSDAFVTFLTCTYIFTVSVCGRQALCTSRRCAAVVNDGSMRVIPWKKMTPALYRVVSLTFVCSISHHAGPPTTTPQPPPIQSTPIGSRSPALRRPRYTFPLPVVTSSCAANSTAANLCDVIGTAKCEVVL